MKSVLRRVAKRLSYIEEARCLKVKCQLFLLEFKIKSLIVSLMDYVTPNKLMRINNETQKPLQTDTITN